MHDTLDAVFVIALILIGGGALYEKWRGRVTYEQVLKALGWVVVSVLVVAAFMSLARLVSYLWSRVPNLVDPERFNHALTYGVVGFWALLMLLVVLLSITNRRKRS
jgi:hypothetical protein